MYETKCPWISLQNPEAFRCIIGNGNFDENFHSLKDLYIMISFPLPAPSHS